MLGVRVRRGAKQIMKRIKTRIIRLIKLSACHFRSLLSEGGGPSCALSPSALSLAWLVSWWALAVGEKGGGRRGEESCCSCLCVCVCDLFLFDY